MNQSHFYSPALAGGTGKRKGFAAFLPKRSTTTKTTTTTTTTTTTWGAWGRSTSNSSSLSITNSSSAAPAWEVENRAPFPSSSSSYLLASSYETAMAPPPTTTTTSPQQQPQPQHRAVDEQTWRYIHNVVFQRLAPGAGSAARAPLGELVEAIQLDVYLNSHHGPAAIAALLRPVASPLQHVTPSASGSAFAMGKAVVWVGFDEFRARCGHPAAAAAAQSTRVSPPKRKRPGGSEAGPPRTSLLGRLGLRREDLARMLRGASYRLEEEQTAAAAQEEKDERAVVDAAHARVEGVLTGFGAQQDAFTRAVAEMEGKLAAVRAARQAEMAALTAGERVEARMAGDPTEALARVRLAPLSEADRAEAKNILNTGKDVDIVVSAFNVDLQRVNIRTLRPGTWLNDEVINFWMSLLDARDRQMVADAQAAGQTRRRCWFFNSFFIAKLLKDDPPYCYKNVRRWSKKAENGDLFAYDKVFFPVNIDNMHWCLAIVHMQKKKIQYLDSMSGDGDFYLEGLKRYLADEYKDKKKQDLDMSEWELVHSDPHITPQQGNGSDCGCFASAFAYLMSEGIPFNHVAQKDMPRFRERMVLSIVKAALTW